jgi:hypothetical protein
MVPDTSKMILKYYYTLKSIEGNGSLKYISEHLRFSTEPPDTMLFLTKMRQNMCHDTEHNNTQNNDTKHKGLI